MADAAGADKKALALELNRTRYTLRIDMRADMCMDISIDICIDMRVEIV